MYLFRHQYRNRLLQLEASGKPYENAYRYWPAISVITQIKLFASAKIPLQEKLNVKTLVGVYTVRNCVTGSRAGHLSFLLYCRVSSPIVAFS